MSYKAKTSILKRFAADRSGNFAMLTAAGVMVLAMAAGFGLNIAQAVNTRANLVQALDAALTSTGRDISTGIIPANQARQTIEAFMAANRKLNSTIVIDDVDVDTTDRTVKASAHIDMKVLFPLFGQANTVRLAANAGTLYSDSTVEMAIMLDVTGSMEEPGSPKNGRRQTKMDNLKDAAIPMIDEVMKLNMPGAAPRVRVALVPYSRGVNSGILSEANFIEHALMPRTIPIGLKVLNQPLFKPIRDLLAWLRPRTDQCTTERKTDDGNGNPVFDLSDVGPGERMVSRHIDFQGGCPDASVVPLTADPTSIKDMIADFEGVGGTAGHIGIQWTRYVLSPQWAAFLESKAPGSAPANYQPSSNKKVRKIAVLLTDGEFNTAFAKSSRNDSSSQTQRSRSYAQRLCSEMKSDNIEVFTIGFMLDDRDAIDTMRNCASRNTADVKYFYEANSAEELNTALRSIGGNVESLRLIN